MNLTTSMLTNVGFLSVNLGNEKLPQPEQRKPPSKKYYVGISGGGWRALAGHMGAFRALSNKGALPMVDMYSAVSGGSWFLSKLSFDDDFAGKVLGNHTHIAEDALQWFENDFFPAIANVTPSPQTTNHDRVRSFVSTMILQGPAPMKISYGDAILAAERYEYSWQKMVEESVLGNDVAKQRLSVAELAPVTRAKFGKECTLAFNWNRLHRWKGNRTTWFLQKHNQADGAPAEHVQYPVYTSALYKRFSNGTHDVEVRAQGKPMEVINLSIFPIKSVINSNYTF